MIQPYADLKGICVRLFLAVFCVIILLTYIIMVQLMLLNDDMN